MGAALSPATACTPEQVLAALDEKDEVEETMRAEILARVLPFINNDDWLDHGDFIVFGQEAFERVGQAHHQDNGGFDWDGLADALKADLGEHEASERLSLNEPTALGRVKKFLNGLPVKNAEELKDALLGLLSEGL